MWQTREPGRRSRRRAATAPTIDLEAPDIPEAFERLEELIEETGRTLVHPFDDPLVMAGQGTVGLEMLEDVPERGRRPRAGRRRRARLRDRDRGQGPQPDARVVAVEPERSRALHARWRPASRSPSRPTSLADGLNAPFAGANCARASCLDARRRVVLVTEDELEGRASGSCTRARSSPASPPAPPRRPRCSPGKVAAGAGPDAWSRSSRAATWRTETAAAILAGR